MHSHKNLNCFVAIYTYFFLKLELLFIVVNCEEDYIFENVDIYKSKCKRVVVNKL